MNYYFNIFLQAHCIPISGNEAIVAIPVSLYFIMRKSIVELFKPEKQVK